jgi:signal transduction histidine kinase/CheY-like chemotaxis protein
MKKPGIYARILFLMTITAVIYLVLLSVLYLIKHKQERLIFNSSREQFDQGVNSIVTLSGASLKQVIVDYTFWDDFVKSIETNDTLWFADNISTVLNSFRFDYVCLYDTNYRIILEKSGSSYHFHDIVPGEALLKLKQKKFLDFYLNTSDGLLNISSGSVHTSDDPTHRRTRPRGYLFLGKVWDKDFLANLSGLSGAEVSISDNPDSVRSTSQYFVSISHKLNGWNGKSVSEISFRKEFRALRLYNDTAWLMQMLIVIFVVVAWLIVRFSTGVWIIRPLKLISRVLASENPDDIKKLKHAPGEFQRIGALFEENISHKKALKIAKEHAEKSDRLKTEFLHNMSHEIRTPINGIMGFSNLLRKPDLDDSEKEEFINIIRHNSEQLLRIIDDILEISKLETKQVRIQNSETNLTHLLSDLYAIFKIKAQEKDILLELTNNLEENESTVMIDESKLLKIINNLVENALKFTSKGFVEVGCSLQHNDLKFYVRDSGIGIDRSNHAKIFERFSQESDSIARKYGGLGLGLSIARENVELLGGTITVQSSQGVGAVFTFTIPYHPVEKALPGIEKSSLSRDGKLSGTLMIAEDDKNNLRFFETILSWSFPQIKTILVTDGQQAVDLCKKDPGIDLVLMDIKMPVMDGYEATRLIKTIRPDLPVVVQTAYSTAEEKNVAVEAGCDDFITKPISEEILGTIIRRYLNGKTEINNKAR